MNSSKKSIKDGFSFSGEILCTLRDLEGNIVEEKLIKNLVVTVVKEQFAALLRNEGTFTGIVNYGAVGTSTASPNVSDTQLGTEIARTTVLSSSRIGPASTIEFNFSPTEANGNLKEFGAFIDGTAIANSGILFDRVSIDITKTSLNSLTIALTITVN